MGRRRNKTVPPPVTPTPMGSGVESGFNAAAAAGGGIRPGAHPEFDQPTDLEKLAISGRAAAQSVAKALQRILSPSTVRAREKG